ncbi:MAG: hypothetical protein A2W31_10365 [Planctomycetes bacterium RBG_16_64_10]|nr:MAG: hypothetical protein A2W31_10365 [Planctomycetes bacterium RBG_16_64_10]
MVKFTTGTVRGGMLSRSGIMQYSHDQAAIPPPVGHFAGQTAFSATLALANCHVNSAACGRSAVGSAHCSPSNTGRTALWLDVMTWLLHHDAAEI